MAIFDNAPSFEFRTRTLGEEFCKRLRDMAYKIDVVTLNDIYKDRKVQLVPEGYSYGYSRKEIKKLKAERSGEIWAVYFPIPGKLVRDKNGYWTTESVDISGGDG